MAIQCITKNRSKDLTFGDVGIYQFFADEDNDLMFKISETHAFFFNRNEVIGFPADEMILRIIENLQIKEL